MAGSVCDFAAGGDVFSADDRPRSPGRTGLFVPVASFGGTRAADAARECFGLGCGDAMATTQGEPTGDDTRMRRSYFRVILVWVITLAALYAFQEYFT
jgi:hypothetical protein